MKWKPRETAGTGLGELKVGPHVILTLTAPGLAGEVGCVRGQPLPCTEGATGLSRRIFPQKKKTLWCSLGNPPAAKAPFSSPRPPPHHLLGDCAHLTWEGAETTGTTQGRVPSNRECAYPPESAHTSSRRELRLQASPRGRVPIHEGVCAPHFRGS